MSRFSFSGLKWWDLRLCHHVIKMDNEGLSTLKDLLNMYILLAFTAQSSPNIIQKSRESTLNSVPLKMKRPSLSYLLRWPNVLAMFSSVSAASLRACSTIRFLFLVSSIRIGFDSGRFWKAAQPQRRNLLENWEQCGGQCRPVICNSVIHHWNYFIE